MKSLLVLCILAIGASASLLLLATSMGWANAHSAPPAAIQQCVILASLSLGTLGWVVLTPFRWRTEPLEIAALVAIGAGQLTLWEWLLHYDFIRTWTLGSALFATVATVSVLIGFGAFLLRPSLDWSKS